MAIPAIQTGLARADFQPFDLAVGPPVTGPLALGRVTPDPVRGSSRVSFTLAKAGRVDLALVDLQGRALRRLAAGTFDAGEHRLPVERGGLAAGIYWLRLESGGEVRHTRFAVLP
jgi:hypothetical protein